MLIDYKGLALFHSMSERTLRRWETEKPGVFNVYLRQYEDSNNISSGSNDAVVIMTLSLKGGVGKSTCCDSLNHYLGSEANNPEESDSVILNLDLAQSAARVNASYTIDYIDYMDQMSVSDLIESLMERYRYVIVDTPGDPTPEVLEALRYSKRIIIPMTIGERTEEATISTLNTYFGSGSSSVGEYLIYFFFNAYTDRRKRDEASIRFKDSYMRFKPSNEISIKSKLGSLDASNAISTVEYSGKSVFQLARENKTAYSVAAKKITALCSSIEDHFDL